MFKKGNIIRDSAIFLDEHMTGNLNILVQVTSKEGEETLKNPNNLKLHQNNIGCRKNTILVLE